MASWEEATGRSRNRGTDTEHERTKIGASGGTYTKTTGQSTGFTGQMANVLAGDVMERAMADKMAMISQGDELYADRADEVEHEEKYNDKDIDDADDDLDAIRARRLAEMKKKAEMRETLKGLGHGTYEEIIELEFLPTVTKSKYAVVHFYHPHFERSKIMDMHMAKMSKKFFETKFVKLNAEKSPFFVNKLSLQTLPCICCFIDGVLKFKQVGFYGLAGGDEFKTAHLARNLRDGGEVLNEGFDSDGEM